MDFCTKLPNGKECGYNKEQDFIMLKVRKSHSLLISMVYH